MCYIVRILIFPTLTFFTWQHHHCPQRHLRHHKRQYFSNDSTTVAPPRRENSQNKSLLRQDSERHCLPLSAPTDQLVVQPVLRQASGGFNSYITSGSTTTFLEELCLQCSQTTPRFVHLSMEGNALNGVIPLVTTEFGSFREATVVYYYDLGTWYSISLDLRHLQGALSTKLITVHFEQRHWLNIHYIIRILSRTFWTDWVEKSFIA